MKIKTVTALSTALGAMTPAERSMGRYMRAPDGHDPFADAFAAAAASKTDGIGEDLTPPAETPPADNAAAPAAAEGGDPAPAAAPAEGGDPAPAEGGDPAPAEGGDPAPAVAPAAAPSAEDIVAQLAEALKNQPPSAAAAPADPQPAAEQQTPLYSAQELEVLSEYEKNWPDVSAAELLKRRAEYHDLLAFTFKSVRDWMAPYLEQIGALGNVAHEQQLRAVVPDYSHNLEAEVTSWIDTQPAYLQAPMKQVMQQGTSEEVADLIGRYRAATGAQQAPAAAAPAALATPKAPAAAPKTELSNAAKQAAESLAPVSGDRSAVPQGEDPQDYVSAFQKYAAAGV